MGPRFAGRVVGVLVSFASAWVPFGLVGLDGLFGPLGVGLAGAPVAAARWGGRRDREPYQVQLIQNRIEYEQPDLVVNIGPAAIDFWQRHRDELPHIPTLSNARESVLAGMELRPGDAGVFAEWSIPRVVADSMPLSLNSAVAASISRWRMPGFSDVVGLDLASLTAQKFCK